MDYPANARPSYAMFDWTKPLWVASRKNHRTFFAHDERAESEA